MGNFHTVEDSPQLAAGSFKSLAGIPFLKRGSRVMYEIA